jgi:GT2 family glycosyltransferase
VTTVDIMLPYYGDPELMRAAVRSVQAQTDPQWRLTVVDDGREPGVPEWFAALDDPRVRYFRNPENLGITGNFRRCVDMVEHDLAVMMGCDDIMWPNYVATMRAAVAAMPGAAMYQPGVRVIDGDGAPVRTLVDAAKKWIGPPARTERARLSGEELAVSLLRGNWLYFPAMCWRSADLKAVSFREDLTVVQDLALVMELLLRGETLVTDPEICFDYRRHAMSESSVQAFSGSRFAEIRRYLYGVADDLDAAGWHRAATVARRHVSTRVHALTMVPRALRHRELGVARNLTSHAFASRPAGRPAEEAAAEPAPSSPTSS